MTEDTFPKLLLNSYHKWGNKKVALRKKELGVWREYTWKDYYQAVKHFSLGLKSLGFERGEKIAIFGDNDPQWFWAEFAAQAVGGIATAIFSDCFPDEAKYIAEHSDSKFIVAQDQEQVDKILQIKNELPLVQKLIYWNSKGMRHYDDPILMSFDEVLQLGREYEKGHPDLFEQEIAKGKGDDICYIAYTSGTTGLPKGSLVNYDFLLDPSMNTFTFNPVYENDEYVSFILPGWTIEQLFGVVAGLMTGQIVNFPEKQETVTENIREIAPHTIMYPSRLWEDLASNIQVKILETHRPFRFIYQICLSIGYKICDLSLENKKPNLFWRTLYKTADLICFRALRDKHGITRVRCPYTAGSLLGPDILRFFQAIGMNLKQIYGSIEGGMGTLHTEDDIRFDTVGIPGLGQCIRISDEDEILLWRDFTGYHKNPEAKEKTFKDGWFYTGDAGYFNEDGHLIYIDRIDDMRQISDGTKFSPQYIESRLKFSPYIKDAFAVGGKERDYVGAVVNINFANVSNWAEKKKINYTTFADLSQRPEVANLIKEEVTKLNNVLPEKSRVKAFVNLHKEFDPDEAELTRTRKLRRTFMEDRYKELVDAIYGDRAELVLEAPVVYRDGRKGMVSTKIRVIHL